MADTAAEIQVTEPGFYSDFHEEISEQDAAVVAQASIARSLADLHGKASVHDRALAMLLRRGDVVSSDNYIYSGELPVGQFKPIYLPDEVTQRGLWKVHSIFAAADKSATVDLQVVIHDLPAGIDWVMLAPKTANFLTDYSQVVGRVLRPTEYGKIGFNLANGATGDKCVVTFNLERVR